MVKTYMCHCIIVGTVFCSSGLWLGYNWYYYKCAISWIICTAFWRPVLPVLVVQVPLIAPASTVYRVIFCVNSLYSQVESSTSCNPSGFKGQGIQAFSWTASPHQRLCSAVVVYEVDPKPISKLWSCRKGQEWAHVTSLLQWMSATSRFEPNIVSYNSAISSCEKSTQW